MDYKARYDLWLKDPAIDEDFKTEIKNIKDEEELKDRFYQDLSFGTAGLRGKIGAGSNRMNKYVVARATYAFAKVIASFGESYKKRGVVIAHDCRIKSDEFAEICAKVLAASGVKAYLYPALRSTPQLSFSVRYLKSAGGINITASHNPKEYNGYKVYFEEGSQIKDDIANLILEEIDKVSTFGEIPMLSDEEAQKSDLIEILGPDIDDEYIKNVESLALNEDIDKNISIVYTPLNGAGNVPVRRVLKDRGFYNVHVVKEQEDPDGTFPTVEYPNPEDLRAFEYSLNLAEKVNADIIIATDPDSDRLAVMSKDGKEYFAFTGNQTGAILIEYILSQKKSRNELPKNGTIVKSIVTGEMGKTIAASYGVETIDVLTGFKNICAVNNEYDKTGEKTVLFGYEESIGYNAGNFVRDKDAVSSAMLLVEAAGYYKKQGLTLKDALFNLFKKHGYFWEDTVSIVLEGIEGKERISRMMKEYRNEYVKTLAGEKLSKIIDYKTSTETDFKSKDTKNISIEKTDAVKYIFEDNSWYALRPSGTEPKIKIYFSAVDKDYKSVQVKLKAMKDVVITAIKKIE